MDEWVEARAQLLVHPVTHHVVVSKEMWAGNLESKGLMAVEAEVRKPDCMLSAC